MYVIHDKCKVITQQINYSLDIRMYGKIKD